MLSGDVVKTLSLELTIFCGMLRGWSRAVSSVQDAVADSSNPDHLRLLQAVEAVAAHINLDWKEPLLTTLEERRLSPPAFRHMLVERARRSQRVPSSIPDVS